MAVLFGVGIWLGNRGIIPFGWLLGGLGVVLVCAVLLLLKRKRALYSLLAICFFLGAAYTSGLNMLPLPEDGKYQISAYITGDVEVRQDDGFTHAYVKNLTAVSENGEVTELSRAYWCMTADNEEELALVTNLRDGDRITFQGKLYVPQGQMNPYGYDFRAYLRQNGVRMVASGGADMMVQPGARLDFSGIMYRLREAIGGRMDQIFGDASVYPKALLLGDKADLPDETRDTFSKLGIAHVLAVSGLHVGLIAGALMFAFKPLHLSPRQKTALLLVFLSVYCALLDFAAPVVRASILLLLTYARRILRRSQDPLTFLAAAFMMILVFEPFSILSLSFQMTFCAVAGMVLLGEPIANKMEHLPRFLRIREMSTMFSATLGVLLPMTRAFHQLSLVSVLVNPIATLLMGVLLPAYGVIMALGCIFLPLGKMLADLLHLLLGWLPAAMENIAAWPWAVIQVPSIPWMLAAALIMVLLLCTRYVVLTGKKRLMIGLCTVVISLGLWQLTLVRDVCYIQLYTGQGDCALILDGRETVVIDTGTNGRDLADYLLSTGRDADTVILTHLHSDHTGGVETLLSENVRIGRVLIPEKGRAQQVDEEAMLALELLAEAGIPIEEVGAGDSVVLPRGRIDFVWPMHVRAGQDANHSCLVSLLQLDGVRILTTGDITGEYEHYVAQPADILKVPHHGSAGSSAEGFLAAVNPAVSIISCAPDRVLPAQATLERLGAQGTEICRTDETGALTVRIRDGHYALDPYLD